VDLWIVQAARVLTPRRRRGPSARTSLDSLVHGDALAEHAAEGLDPSLAFALKLARALLGCGMPSHRVEEALQRLAAPLGLEIDAFCTPTVLVATISKEGGTPADVRTRVVRVEPGATDLERLSALHDLAARVEKKELTPGDAALRVEAILARPPRYGVAVRARAFARVWAGSAALLGGGGLDVPTAGALGLWVGGLDAAAQRREAVGRLLPALAAVSVSFLASLLAWQGMPIRPSVVLLAALVVLLPGLTVTTATLELATANLVSGTARMIGGAVTFLQLAFGVALGRKLAEVFPRLPRPPPTPELPHWAVALSAIVCALGFTLLLRARPKDGVWVTLAVAIALAGSQLGGAWMGAELGAFVGALAVATAAHAHARLGDRPVNLMLVPGILFLVPGSVGFLSVASLLENRALDAVATAFRMGLVAMALAAGILVATAAVPPRRAF
jgi:uncharacterized membrane protein YjjP (DUF1212 family)